MHAPAASGACVAQAANANGNAPSMKRFVLVVATGAANASMPVTAFSDEHARVRLTDELRYSVAPPVIMEGAYSVSLAAAPHGHASGRLSRYANYALPDLQRYIDTSTASGYSNQPMRVNMLVDSNEKTVSLGADILVGTQTVLKEDFRKFIEDSGYDRVYLELRIQF
jgi:hypothetical protein